jgi:hypothetical protein
MGVDMLRKVILVLAILFLAVSPCLAEIDEVLGQPVAAGGGSSGESLHIVAAAGADSFAVLDLGGDYDNPDPIIWYMYLSSTGTSFPSDAAADNAFFCGVDTDTTLSNSDGMVVYFNDADSGANADTLYPRSANYGDNHPDIDYDEWAKYELDWNENASSTLTVTSSSQPSGVVSTFTAADVSIRYLFLGADGNFDGDEEFEAYYEDVSGVLAETFDTNPGYDRGGSWSETIGSGGTVDEDSDAQVRE